MDIFRLIVLWYTIIILLACLLIISRFGNTKYIRIDRED
jgi:hypothetical protein